MTMQQKVCAIVVDGMKIKSGLTYNQKKDLIDGYEDKGGYGRRTKLAQQAIVFMIKGEKGGQIYICFFELP